MFGLFFRTTKFIPLSLVVDIESGSVGAALFLTQKSGKPLLLHTDRESVPFPKQQNSRALLHAMRASLEALLDRVVRDAFFDLNSTAGTRYRIVFADVVISSPWYLAENKSITMRFDVPKMFSEAVVYRALGTEEQDFEASAEQKPHAHYEVVERKIMRITLNGYPTSAPYGRRAVSADCSVALAIAPQGFLNSIRSTLTRLLPDITVHFHTFMLTAFATIRDRWPERGDFLLVHVGGEVTDIIAVRHGTISEIASFPMGQNTLTRYTVKFFAGSPHASVESLLTLSRERAVGMKDKARIDRAILEARAAWVKLFSNTLAEFSDSVFLPRHVLLVDSGPHAKMFEEFLGSADWRRFGISTESIQVKMISTEESDVFSERTQGAISDVPLSIQASFLSRFVDSRDTRIRL